MKAIILLILVASAIAEKCGEAEGALGSCESACGAGTIEINSPCKDGKKCCETTDPLWCGAVVPKDNDVLHETGVFGICRLDSNGCTEKEESVAASTCESGSKCCVEKTYLAKIRTKEFQDAFAEELKEKHENFFEEFGKAIKTTKTNPLLKKRMNVRNQLALKPRKSLIETSNRVKATCMKRGELPMLKHKADACTNGGTVNDNNFNANQWCCDAQAPDEENGMNGGVSVPTCNNNAVLVDQQGNPNPNGPCCAASCEERGGVDEGGRCVFACHRNNQVQCARWYCVDTPEDCKYLWMQVSAAVGTPTIGIFTVLTGGHEALFNTLSKMFTLEGGSTAILGVIAIFKSLVQNRCPLPNPALKPFT